jgi:hypothetical protein
VFDFFKFTGDARVKEEVGVEISVPCVENVDRRDADRIGCVVDKVEHFCEAALGDNSILYDVRRANPSEKSAARFSSFPEPLSDVVLIAEGHVIGTGFTQNARDGVDSGIHERRWSIDFGDEQEVPFWQTDGHLAAFNHSDAAWIKHLDGCRKRGMSDERMDC